MKTQKTGVPEAPSSVDKLIVRPPPVWFIGGICENGVQEPYLAPGRTGRRPNFHFNFRFPHLEVKFRVHQINYS